MRSNNDIKKIVNSFFLRRYDHLRKLIDREKIDQEPCYYKRKYGLVKGFKIYFNTVINSVAEFMVSSLPNFFDMKEEDEDEITEILLSSIHDMFFDEIENYYNDINCTEYNQRINGIYESVSEEELKRLRRIQEVRNTIEFQTEVQDPYNFDDGEEYADFCIGEGLSFFYGDEGYEREDDIFQDEKEHHLRDEISSMMYEEFFDYLVGLWNDSMSQEIEW